MIYLSPGGLRSTGAAAAASGRAAVRIGSHVAGRTRRRAILQAIVAAAVINIPDSDHAAITLVTTGGKVSTPARFQVPRLNGWNGCRS